MVHVGETHFRKFAAVDIQPFKSCNNKTIIDKSYIQRKMFLCVDDKISCVQCRYGVQFPIQLVLNKVLSNLIVNNIRRRLTFLSINCKSDLWIVVSIDRYLVLFLSVYSELTLIMFRCNCCSCDCSFC
jgi:hypothetical protein